MKTLRQVALAYNKGEIESQEAVQNGGSFD